MTTKLFGIALSIGLLYGSSTFGAHPHLISIEGKLEKIERNFLVIKTKDSSVKIPKDALPMNQRKAGAMVTVQVAPAALIAMN